jgi:EpsI family protein
MISSMFIPGRRTLTARTAPFELRAAILAALMLGAFLLSAALTPRRHVMAQDVQFKLEDIMPRQFGDWRMDEQTLYAVVNPQAQEYLKTIYSQTLSRTYIHSNGRRIMLSLAYGADQSHDNQIHKPEVCYPAQGFQVISKKNDFVHAGAADLPVMRIVTKLGNRHEPVTYWIRMGNSLVRGAIEQNIARVGYGLKGYVPDGILFRISEINPNSENSYALQDQFIKSLLPSLTADAQKILIGKYALIPESSTND